MEEQYKYELKRARNIYKKFKPISCKALKNEVVNFTYDGFNHLRYKRNRSERDRKQQIMRFRLLESAYETIGKTTTFQESEERLEQVKVKIKKQSTTENKIVKYWGFIAITENNDRIKVVIRRIGEGQLHFWSVYPWWEVTRHNGFSRRDMSTKELSTD